MRGHQLCSAHLGTARGPDPIEPSTQLVEQLVAMLRAGNLIAVSARAVGVSRATLYRWLDKALDPKSPAIYGELREAVERARAEGQVRLVAQIAAAAASDWRAAAWLLGRGYEEWAQNVTRADDDVTSGTGGTPKHDPFREIDELAEKRLAKGRTTPG